MAPRSMAAEREASILWTLKHDGDITEWRGKATAILMERLEARGAGMSVTYANKFLFGLQNRGLVTRELGPGGKGTLAFHLVSTGDYPDPFESQETNETGLFSISDVQPPTNSLAKKPKRTGRVDRILRDIEALPLPERLMLVGMVADGCAGEVDETYNKLRSVLGAI